MSRHRWTLRALIGVAACGFMITGCSADPSPPDASRAPEGAWSALISQIDTVGVANAVAARKAELVTSCMAEQGFTHIPYTVEGMYEGTSPLEVAMARDDFADTWGLGTFFPHASNPEIPTPEQDPNAAYVAALTESERAAYDAALWGKKRDSTDGCLAEVDLAVSADPRAFDSALDDPRYVELTQSLPSSTSVRADHRVITVADAWHACMAASGLPFAHPEDVWEDMDTRREALVDVHPEAYTADDAGTYSFDQSHPAVQEALALDVTIARSKKACDAAHPVDAVEGQVYTELENTWYDAHEAEIAAWFDDYRHTTVESRSRVPLREDPGP